MSRARGRSAALTALLDLPQFRRYLVAGGGAALLHLSILTVLVERFGWSAHLATSLAFGVVAMLGFIVHHNWVYRSPLPMRRTAPRFLTVAVVAFTVNGATVYLGTTQLSAHYGLVQLVAFVLIPLSNYVMHTLWSFAAQKPSR